MTELYWKRRYLLIKYLIEQGYTALVDVKTNSQLKEKVERIYFNEWTDFDEATDNEIEKRNQQNVAFLKSELKKQRSRQSADERKFINRITKDPKLKKITTATGRIIKYDVSKERMADEAFNNEVLNAEVFANFGFDVCLPKEDHTKYGVKCADAIIDGVWVELKHISGTVSTAYKDYRKGLRQCINVAMYIESSKAILGKDAFFNKMASAKRVNTRKKGLLITYFKDTNELFVDDMSV